MTSITHIRLSSTGKQHEHITHVMWQSGSGAGISTVAEMVAHIRAGNRVYVTDRQSAVEVTVVAGPPPFLRTVANGRYTDNLLALPRC